MLPILALLTVIGAPGVDVDPWAVVGLPEGHSQSAAVCVDGAPYYAFELVTTKNIPGTGLAIGTVEASVAATSPFSVQLAADGSYAYELHVALDRMRAPRQGQLVAWVTTPDIDEIVRLSALDEHLQASGRVDWNKYIVVITLEPSDDPTQEMWTGPIVMRGMSRSGMMHTMVGHGALQQENCAAYGYGN